MVKLEITVVDISVPYWGKMNADIMPSSALALHVVKQGHEYTRVSLWTTSSNCDRVDAYS